MTGQAHISALVWVAACTWAIALLINGTDVSWEYAKPFSVVVSVVSGVIVLFDRWLWRLPFVNSLVGRPKLEGTYWGELRSEWTDATGQRVAPIPIAMVVRQTHTTLTLTLFTPESSSTTLAAAIELAPDGRYSVVGVYRNEPKLSIQDRSRVHHGGLRLQVIESPAQLVGSYWTDRRTQGEIELARVSTGRAASYSAARDMGLA
jgi:SMODS-associating 2TM, beta-strand rich effector domain